MLKMSSGEAEGKNADIHLEQRLSKGLNETQLLLIGHDCHPASFWNAYQSSFQWLHPGEADINGLVVLSLLPSLSKQKGIIARLDVWYSRYIPWTDDQRLKFCGAKNNITTNLL